MFTSRYVTERGIGSLDDGDGTFRALEDRLIAFTSDVAEAGVDEGDEDGATRRYVTMLAEAGLLRLVVPAAYGGAYEGVSCRAVCLARQHLARHSGALDTAFVMQGLGSHPLVLANSPLADTLLPEVVAGRLVCGFALTEPEAGSDVARMQTRAEDDGRGGAVLTGTKWFISNATCAHGFSVFAREAEDGPDGKPRFSAFWVPADAKGLSVEPMQVLAPHPIGKLVFDGVEVPATHRLGPPGKGLAIAFGNLDVFRPTVGAAALGLADRALAEATAHLSTRVQFGRPLATQQGLRFRLAELATDHLAAQLLVYRAAAARDAGRGTPAISAMAKLSATETAQAVVDAAVQFLGGRGVLVGERVEALYREVRALRIYEGTSEIQKLIIARALFETPYAC
ncbi:MAG: acyl-CoA dehydrogenase [Deltaproteobacteria bacterium]|nr:MAG: acyl-CoA dehydrogenase [Deltaproteobacteria bacterium]